MTDARDEETRLHQVALRNAQVIHQARRHAESEQRKQMELLRITLSSIGDAVITADAEGRVTLMNAMAESFTGWRQSEALGLPMTDVIRIVSSDTHRPVDNPALAVLREGATASFDEYGILIAKDGTELPIEGTAAPIRAEDGAILGAVLIFRDMRERHSAEVMRREIESDRETLLGSERAARAEAERAGNVKEAFLALLSHELRTPLTAIVGWTQILRSKPPTQQSLEQGLSVIDRNARIQSKLIADLLDMSRIISGKMRIEVEPLDFAPIIAAAIESIRPAADAKDIAIEASLEPMSEATSGDPQRLQQIVWNLLSNAVKFTPRGGRVQVKLSRMNENVDIVISDTGEGISNEFLPYVFDRFRQAENTPAREYGGLGLGLAIVKQLVELHGGNVCAISEGKGKGASFVVQLPLAASEAAIQGTEAHEKSGSFAALQSPLPDLAGVTVLVVDDEADSREVIRTVLEDCGAQVKLANSASDAMTAIDREKPDVILSDIGMPRRDGYAFMSDVRRRGIRTPAAAVTAYARPEDRTRALQAGYQAYLAKPLDVGELAATVAALAHRTASESGVPGPETALDSK